MFYKKLTYIATRPSLDVPWQFQVEPDFTMAALFQSNPDITLMIQDQYELTYKAIIQFASQEAVDAFVETWNISGPALEAYNAQHGITTQTIEE